ncbi:MAG: 50S ribosomal protein L34 [Planctomycetes bacterium]|nr:50S ribosomal protein L34 [Planctomycetota bacterium]
MKTNVRKSNIKREKRGFRYRMKTRGGRQVIKRRRALGRKLPGFKKSRGK